MSHRNTPPSDQPITLAAFTRWKLRRSYAWQLADFRELCIDLGVARSKRLLLDWLRDFEAHTKDDAWMFDADGGGSFVRR